MNEPKEIQVEVKYHPGKWIRTTVRIIAGSLVYCPSDGCYYRKGQWRPIKK